MNISRKYTANLSGYARYHSGRNRKKSFAVAARVVDASSALQFEVQGGKYFILLFESQEIFHE